MRLLSYIAGLAGLSVLVSSALARGDSPLETQLLVGTKSHSAESVAKVVANVGTVLKRDSQSGLFFVQLKKGLDPEKIESKLAKDARVLHVLPASSTIVDHSNYFSVKDHVEYLEACKKGKDDESGDYYDALKFYLEDRVGPDGKVDRKAYDDATAHRGHMPAAEIGDHENVLSNKWSYVGPTNLDIPYRRYYGIKPLSGRVNAIAVDPTNSSIIYIGAAAGGVWKTTDAGVTWTPKSDTWPFMQVSSLAIDPNNHNIIYAGTGDWQGGLPYQFGIMKSTDGGNSWTNYGKADFGSYAVTKILIEPENSQNIIITTANGGTGYCWRSVNGGQTWAQLKGVAGKPDPGWNNWTSATMGTKNSNGVRAFWIAGYGYHGLFYKSVDHGATWAQVLGPDGIGDQTMVDIAASGRTAGNGPNVLFALFTASQKIYRTTTGGATWTDISGSGSFPAALGDKPQYNWSQKSYDHHIGTIPNTSTGDDVVFVGLITVATSRIGNGAWKDVALTYDANSLMHNDQHSFAVDPNHPNVAFLGNDGGIFKCVYDMDAGTGTITSLNKNLGITTFYHMDAHPSNSSWIMGGAQDQATPASRGSLSSWGNVGGGDGGYCLFDKNTPATQYVTGQYLSLSKTTDGWATNSDISYQTGSAPNIIYWKNEPTAFIAPIALSNDQKTLYAGTNRLWKYTGGSWTSDLGNKTLSATDVIRCITTCPSNSNVIYTGAKDAELWKTTDAGATWKKMNSGLPTRTIKVISVNPNTSADILVGLSSTGTAHLYRCSDTTVATPTFVDVDGSGATGLPNVPVNGIARDPYAPSSTWYVATDVGVFMTTDAGATWKNATQPLGLPNVQVDDLKMADTGYLYAATYGRGIWRIKVVALALSGLSMPTTTGGGSYNGTVYLNGYSKTPGTNVSITSNNTAAAKPTSSVVTVPDGTDHALVPFTTNPVAVDTEVGFTATYNGVSKTTYFYVKAPVASLVLLSPSSVVGGKNTTGTVYLTGKAAINKTVSLSSGVSGATVPSSVVVPAGSSYASFPIKTYPVTLTKSGPISATLGVTKSATLTLNKGGLISFIWNPNQIMGGATAQGRVEISGPAPSGGTTITFQQVPSQYMTMPASVTIPAGTTYTYFYVPTVQQTSVHPLQIAATLDDFTLLGGLTLTPGLSSVSVSPASAVGGQTLTGTVTLLGPSGSNGSNVLVSSNSSAAKVPAFANVPANSSQGTFPITTTGVLSSQVVTISAKAAGVTKTTTFTLDPTILTGISFEPNPVVGGNIVDCTLTFNGVEPAGGTTVSVLSSNSAVAKVPATVTWHNGLRTLTFRFATAAVRSNTTVTIQAKLGSSTIQGNLVVTP